MVETNGQAVHNNQTRPDPAPNARSGRAATALVTLALIAGVVWAIYGRAINGPFFFDDLDSTVENASITRLWPLVTTDGQPGPLNRLPVSPVSGRPLVNLTLALNYHFGQLNPVGYHAFNIVAHILAALVLFGVVRRTLRLPYFEGTLDGASEWLALFTALLWAAHPLLTESVAYVTQRTELLVGLFFLATLYAAIRHWTEPAPRASARWRSAAVIACLAGMASKEVMVTAPMLVLLFDRTFIAGSFRSAWRSSRPLYVGLAATWLILVLLNYDSPRGTTAGFATKVPALAWWATQSRALMLYLKLSIWPAPLSIHYEYALLRTLGSAWPWVLATAAMASATGALLWRRRASGLVGAWVLLILSPTFTIPMTTEVIAERRMYLPLAGVIAFAIVGTWRLSRRAGGTAPRQWISAAGGVVLAALVIASSVASARRAALYNDEALLWRDALASQPNDALAHYNLGIVLGDRGAIDEAIGHFETAIRIDPTYTSAHFNMAVALGDAERPLEAIPHFEIAMRSNPPDASAHLIYGITLTRAGRIADAVTQLERAHALAPADLTIYPLLADAHARANHPAQAIALAEEAVRLARSTGQDSLAPPIEDWLRRYRARTAGTIRSKR